LNAEWDDHLAGVRADPDDRTRRFRAVRWVLVNTFGDEERYLTDPEFAYAVRVAGRMIDALNRREVAL
jgi:hypothetical protein